MPDYFDPAWYLRTYPDVAQAGVDPWKHYLSHGRAEGRQPGPNRVLAWSHHLWRGLSALMLPRLEGLLEDAAAPVYERELALVELMVWYGAEGEFEEVCRLGEGWLGLESSPLKDPSPLAPLPEGEGNDGDPSPLINKPSPLAPPETSDRPEGEGNYGEGSNEIPRARVLYLLWLEACLALEPGGVGGERLVEVLRWRWPRWPCRWLAEANWAAAGFPVPGSNVVGTLAEKRWLTAVNALFVQEGLNPLALAASDAPLFDRLMADHTEPLPVNVPRWRRWLALPTVSVVVPAFNAQACLETALRSLEAQQWPNLDVIVVNDASSDDTAALAEAWCEAANRRSRRGQRRRWRAVHHEQNRGAYAARNTGVGLAKGAYITVMDADDCAHPQKIALQAQALMKAPKLQGSLSHWVRMSEGGRFNRWRIEEGWVYRNVSSLMLRASVVKVLGFWHEVPVNADTEYYERVLAAYGPEALTEVMPGVPLSFGRHDGGSLSQRSATHLRTQFLGWRKDYMDGVRRWHRRFGGRVELLFEGPSWLKTPSQFQNPSPQPSPQRGEGVARALSPLGFIPARVRGLGEGAVNAEGEVEDWQQMDFVQQSGWFDPVWYIDTHADLQNVVVDAFEHWWLHGVNEGRDPCAGFSVSGYRLRYGGELGSLNPLYHFLTVGKDKGYSARPVLAGGVAEQEGGPWVLVAAHQAGVQLYGAERSLLDVLAGLQRLGVNVSVLLPSAVNLEYVGQIKTLAQQVVVAPLPWWRQGRSVWAEVQAFVESVLAQRLYAGVYLNTLVHHEVELAARARGVPVWCHVRELPEADPSLCQLLEATPEQVQVHALGLSDVLVANSAVVARYFDAPRTLVVPNVVDVSALEALPLPQQQRLQVGLVSSNLPKKGLEDFAQVARRLAEQGVEVDMRLIGPENDHTRVLQQEGIANLVVAGYAASPQAAMAQLDVLLNLSHFQESFGRTVLEAMAAGRPVVAYEWGALPELVVQGETGFLLPLGAVDAVVECIVELAGDEGLRSRLGAAGQQRARESYSLASLVKGLGVLLEPPML